MVEHHHHFHFFGGKELNALYLTIGLSSFGARLIGVFVPIYFWGLGFSIAKILLFYFLTYLYFVILAMVFVVLLRKISDKMMMFLGTAFLILYFFGLGFMDSVPLLFYALPVAASLHQLLFVLGYHTDFASVVEKDHVGEEVGARHMIISLFGLGAPFMGGILITIYGFHATFFIGVVVLFLAVIPMFLFPKKKMTSSMNRESIKKYITNNSLEPFNISCIGYAIENAIGTIVWPLFVFFAVGSIGKLGGIASLGLLVAIIVNLVTGFLSDIGKRRKTLFTASSLLSVIWFLRALIQSTPFVVGSHIGGKFMYQAAVVPWSSQYYKIAKSVADPSSFILSREVLYKLSRTIFIPVLILISLIFSQSTFFTIAFIFAGLSTLLFQVANKLHTDDLRDGYLIKKKI